MPIFGRLAKLKELHARTSNYIMASASAGGNSPDCAASDGDGISQVADAAPVKKSQGQGPSDPPEGTAKYRPGTIDNDGHSDHVNEDNSFGDSCSHHRKEDVSGVIVDPESPDDIVAAVATSPVTKSGIDCDDAGADISPTPSPFQYQHLPTSRSDKSQGSSDATNSSSADGHSGSAAGAQPGAAASIEEESRSGAGVGTGDRCSSSPRGVTTTTTTTTTATSSSGSRRSSTTTTAKSTASSRSRRGGGGGRQATYFSTGRDFYDDGYYNNNNSGNSSSDNVVVVTAPAANAASPCGGGSRDNDSSAADPSAVVDSPTGISLGSSTNASSEDSDEDDDDETEDSIDDRLDFSPHLWGRQQDIYTLLQVYKQVQAGPPPQTQVTTGGTTTATTPLAPQGGGGDTGVNIDDPNQDTTNRKSNSPFSKSPGGGGSGGGGGGGGGCHTVMVRGVSGTGKSTLVEQFCTILQQHNGRNGEDTSRSISTGTLRRLQPNHNNRKDNTTKRGRNNSNSSSHRHSNENHSQSNTDGQGTENEPSSLKTMPFFLSGKFNDEFSGGAGCQNNPLSAIVEAFSNFAHSLLLSLDGDDGRNDTEFDRVQQSIQLALGSEAQELLEGLIPALSPLFRRTTSVRDEEKDEVALDVEPVESPQESNRSNNHVTNSASPNPQLLAGEKSTSSMPTNALNRLKYIFPKFCNAIASQERPVILFLDDLQWCDAASLELLQSLLTDRSLRYFMFIGAYRSDEVEDGLVSPAFPQMLHVLEQKGDSTNSSTFTGNALEYIDVCNLTIDELAGFVGGAMKVEKLDDASDDDYQTILELTKIIYGKTGGNIFFSKQILEQLHREGYIEFSRLTFRWECHLEGKDDLDDLLSDDVLKTVTTKIHNAPANLQRVLVVAAYTRSTVDIDTLWLLTQHDKEKTTYQVSSVTHLNKILDDAVLDGLLTNNTGSKNYSFAHDRIQQAAFALIPNGQERDQFRLRIGLKLLEIAGQGNCANDSEWMLFAAAEHLNAASFLYRMHHDPMKLTCLNLKVGELAANKLAYETASKYLMLVMQDLNRLTKGKDQDGQTCSNPWETHYSLTLQTYRLLADVQLRQGHYDTGASSGNQVLQNARCLEDRLSTQMAMTKAYGRQELHKDSIAMGTRALRELKCYPRRSLSLHCGLVKNLLYVKRYFKNTTDNEILNLSPLTDPHKLAAMAFLESNAYHNYTIGNTFGFLADTLMMLRLTFKHGLCGRSGVALTGYSLFCNNLNEMEGAYRFSDLARKVLDHTRAKELECLQFFVVAHWISSWKEPHQKVLQTFDRAHRSGMESGDFENGLLSLTARYHHEYSAGFHLGPLDEKYGELMQKLETYQIRSILVMSVEQRRKIQHLKGDVVPPLDVDELSKFGPVKHDKSELYGLLYGYLCRLELSVYFGNLQFAEKMVKKLISISDFDKSYTTNSLRLFFICLTFTSLARIRRKQPYIRKARRHLKDLTNLCNIKGMNSWHKCLIMEAHLKSVTGWGESRVEAGYDLAIQASLNNGHHQDAALACHLAGEYFASSRMAQKNPITAEARDSLSRKYLAKASSLYRQWGAYAMVHHLETKHGSLLKPTLHRDSTEKVTVEVYDSFGGSSRIDEGLVSGVLTTQAQANDDVSLMTELTSWREPAKEHPLSNAADHCLLEE